MKTNFSIENGNLFEGQKFFVVSNYTQINKVSTYGFRNMPKVTDYDLGVWKIKNLKK